MEIEHFVHMEIVFQCQLSQCIKSLNWTYLYDESFLSRASVPNHPRDSFILIKLNTLYTWKQCFSVNQSQCIKSLNWTYLYDADVFLQFRVLIRVIELNSVPDHPRNSFNHFVLMERVLDVNLYWVLIRVLELIPSRITPEIHLF